MKKILILFGGNSFEHKISCMSAKNILENIDRNKYEVTSVGIDYDNKWYLYKDNVKDLENWKNYTNEEIDNIVTFLKMFDIVFPVLHGANGEDGRLQGMLDLFNIKYVGCKTLSSSICMDKIFTKYIIHSLQIPQVPFLEIKTNKNLDNVIKELGFPMIIKPANGGSSIGISKVHTKKELKSAIKEAKKYDSKVIAEKFIHAKELECAILEDKKIMASSVGEIKSANEFYDYNAKYENDKSHIIIPAEIEESIEKQIQEYAKKAFIGINASSLSRVDFLYDEKNNQIYLNEINTLPGFTFASMYPKLFLYNGYSYQSLITTLIENA